MKKTVSIVLWLLLLGAACFGQASFQGLTPGASTRSDVARVLGQPVSNVSETLSEYSPPPGRSISTVYVQFRKISQVVERIETRLLTPVPRASLIKELRLPQLGDAEEMNAQGYPMEYFGGQASVVLTYAPGETRSAVSRIGYYSRELFESAVAKLPRTPKFRDEGSAYAAWYEVRSDISEASAKAGAYLRQFPEGQHADYLKQWMVAVTATSFNHAVSAKNVAEMIRIGKTVLAVDPDNLDYLYVLVYQISINELFARPPNFAHAPEVAEFTQRAIRLLEAGKTPTPTAQRFDRNVTLAYMHDTLGVIYEHDQNLDKALREFEVAATLEPSEPWNPFQCGCIHNNKYAIATQRLQTLPDQSAEANALYDDVLREADAIIDSWSRFLALTARNDQWGQTRSQIEGVVTQLRTFRNEVNSDKSSGGIESVKKSGKLERLGRFLSDMTRGLLQSVKPPDQ